jgi:stage V sporulation protein G
VDITLDECWMFHGLKVLRHEKAMRLPMPQRKWRKGDHYTIRLSVNAEAQRMIEEAVMVEYRKVTGGPLEANRENL